MCSAHGAKLISAGLTFNLNYAAEFNSVEVLWYDGAEYHTRKKNLIIVDHLLEDVMASAHIEIIT